MGLLRDLGRRRLRTALTILGVTIGIWALVVFDSMASKIDAMVTGGREFYAGKLSANARGGAGFAQSPLDIGIAERVEGLPGVDVAVPGVMLLLSDESTSLTMGQSLIIGQVAGADRGRETWRLGIATGRDLAVGDEGADVTVLGSDLARQWGAAVGDAVTLRGESFLVVGILEPTLTMPDLTAMVPLASAQRLYLRSLPSLVAGSLDQATIVNGLTIYPRPGADPEALAGVIRAAEPDLVVATAGDFDRQIGSLTAVLNGILVGVALISLVVGGLSVINTMAMSVAERTREIGVRRAIGASRLRIVGSLVAESGLIGLIGGVVGLAGGALVVLAANELGRTSGFVLFLLTPWTALTALLFSTGLGALAGLVPALHAARLDPVAALRYE